jgi:cytochrome c-type biogenesis protein CcsB
MKKALGFLFSFPLMGTILFLFAVAVGVATFIESDYGTSTARAVVYNSRWFEGLLFLGIINITGIIIKQKLYKKEKFTLFLLHLAFVIILIGSAITRFFGFEGVMHIRSGNTENKVLSNDTYLYASSQLNGKSVEKSKKIFFSALTDNYHNIVLENNGRKALIECLEIIPNAVEIAKIVPEGKPVLEIVIAGMHGKQEISLQQGKTKKVDGLSISLDDSTNIEGINISLNNSGMYIYSPYEMVIVNMQEESQEIMPANELHSFKMKMLYSVLGIQLVATNFYPSAEIGVTSSVDDENSIRPTAVNFRITVDNQSRNYLYFADENTTSLPDTLSFGGVDFSIGYSPRPIELPFSLKLDEFILEHYPGSMSPSWFESKITLIDSANAYTKQHRIFMNNVLKYKGYRFYQSSYDNDERGTILSVNHDFWGTFVTYLGYLLMALGMIASLFIRRSYFNELSRKLAELREKKKLLRKNTLIVVLALLPFFSANSQDQMHKPFVIPQEQAKLFGKVLVQDPGGRIKPVNSLNSELLRKISRKTVFMDQSSDQVILGMLVFPEYWQTVPMIKASNPDIMKLLNTDEKLIAFNRFFGEGHNNQYILSTYVDEAYSKIPASRSKFDTEIIRLDERINLCYMIYTGEILKIFPKPEDRTYTWYHPGNVQSHFKGNDSIFVSNVLYTYFDNMREAAQTGNWTNNEATVNSLIAFQSKYGKDVLPSTTKIKAEILYNKLDLFQRISVFYGLIGFILLVFQFIGVFVPRFNLKSVFKVAFVLLFTCFGFHIFGLGLRWYVSGHAPWSNGYESMIYIGFATILAGIILYRKAEIVLSVTAILTSIILSVAHLNWMDPEITNLVPVLKSYWLVIHVAVITASYGFLALAALTAFVNLLLMIFQNQKNYSFTDITISELTAVIQMALIIGLYMLSIGTFLGGVWANESWGRYWGWDSKEAWALVTILWYALVGHLRLIPRLKGNVLFNIMALISFATVIMTYFGVNYYLTGLHSYAKGDSVGLPAFAYKTIILISVVIILAVSNQKVILKRKGKPIKLS